MAENQKKAQKVDLVQLIKTKSPISIQNSRSTSAFIESVHKVLQYILKVKNYEHLYTPLSFVIKELIQNANQANLKRVFFRINSLNSSEPKDYKEGLKKFEKLMEEDPESLTKYLDEYSMFLKVTFQDYMDDTFLIKIANNSNISADNIIVSESSLEVMDLNKKEKKRISEKILEFEQIKNNYDKCGQILEEKDSDGLGIFLALKMLEGVGVNPKSLFFEVFEFMTTANVKFDYEEVVKPPYSDIAAGILTEIKELPKFPDNITAIINKLQNEDVTIDQIVSDIEKDPSLSAELLKLVNSAQYMLNRKISSIKEGLTYVGLKGLRNLLYSYGAMKLMTEKYGQVKEVWDHSYETARIASFIAKDKNLDTKDDVFFTSGLLHDMGKIVLISMDKEKEENLEKLCGQRGIELPILEDVLMGVSHAKIGGEIAAMWDFPEELISAINYHHDPILEFDKKEIVYITYIANYLAKIKSEKELDVHAIELEVRKFFTLKTPEIFLDFAKKYIKI